MKIIFRKDYTVQAVDGKSYKKGESYDVTADAAQHFITRGVAVNAATAKVVEKIEPPVVEPESDPVPRMAKAQKSYRKKHLEQ